MATCKDCIHEKVCKNAYLFKVMPPNVCGYFKNNSDYAEVKHGYWKEYFSAGAFHYDCSNCDYGFATKERDEKVPNYCENCGSYMDGQKNDFKE